MEIAMVDVVFLGTGGAFSAGRRSNLALLIEAPNFRMLVEAGPVIMQQLARANLQASDIDRLALNRGGAPNPLRIYAGTRTIAVLQTLWRLACPGLDDRWANLQWHELSEQGPEETKLTEGITLRTVLVPHPPDVPTLGARWDFGECSVTFVTDTIPSAATTELAQGSDLLIHEASFSAVLQPGVDAAAHFHSTARQAGEIARQAGCPRLALVHLGPEIGEQPDVLVKEARASTDLQVTVPEDGERIRL
jgi:ribonuclease BN (tRNA processing enzyme)